MASTLYPSALQYLLVISCTTTARATTFTPTESPTPYPTTSPTAKPTNLPTANRTVYDLPDCVGMTVMYLDELFPDAQSSEQFNQLYNEDGETEIYNSRRVWSNGALDIYFTDRFESSGDWIITNGSYTAISISDANADNANITNNPLPGLYPSGYIYFDHFDHDNILGKPDAEASLYFDCEETGFPSYTPTTAPTTSSPTEYPITGIPTHSPTAECGALCIESLSEDECGSDDEGVDIGLLFIGCFNKDNDDLDGKGVWYGIDDGIDDVDGYIVFYSDNQGHWTIFGDDGYSALSHNGTNKEPPGLTAAAGWSVFDNENYFDVGCTIRFQYSCYSSSAPTLEPTLSPTTPSPTTSEPSSFPTESPSSDPTNAPTVAPSESPSMAPTAAPIRECNGLRLNGTDSMDGMYRKESEQIAGRNVWKSTSMHSDTEIFWSTSSYHESWVIHSEILGKYWLSINTPNEQPLLSSEWELISDKVFIVMETRTLQFECFATLPPTFEPTPAPSTAPTLTPSVAPTDTPSRSPSTAPTPAPSMEPTPSPTTPDPTVDPTSFPSTMPTVQPIAEDCSFLLISNPLGANQSAVAEYTGVYELENVTDAMVWKRYNDDIEVGTLQNMNGTWVLSSNTMDTTLSVGGFTQNPPSLATNWKLSGDLDSNYTLFVDCSVSDVPTNAPTATPTNVPSSAPTSSCYGLYFENLDVSNFSFNGWYQRQNDYAINDHKYWKSLDGRNRIEFSNGNWYLMETDLDLLDDEDPVMVISGGNELLSPPSGQWVDIRTLRHYNVSINISCDATYHPTSQPTASPSAEPTVYTALTWASCPDTLIWFSFITENETAVYWPEPTVNDHFLSVDVLLKNSAYQIIDDSPGDTLAIGPHDLKYVASDGFEEIECDVTVYVLGGAGFGSFDFCQRESYSIVDFWFDDSYYKLADDLEADEVGEEINGEVTHPTLTAKGKKCFVIAGQVTSSSAVGVADEAAVSAFFGFEFDAFYFEIAVAVFTLCLLCLLMDWFCRCCRDRRKNKEHNEMVGASLLDSKSGSQEAEAEKRQQEMASGRVGGAVEMQPAMAMNAQKSASSALIVAADDDSDEMQQPQPQMQDNGNADEYDDEFDDDGEVFRI